MGIEPTRSAWKAEVLPLNYTRMEWWGETDSNHRTRRELSYSQPRLATSLPPHWCRLEELNPQPTDYKSVALPIELSRRVKLNFNKNGGG